MGECATGARLRLGVSGDRRYYPLQFGHSSTYSCNHDTVCAEVARAIAQNGMIGQLSPVFFPIGRPCFFAHRQAGQPALRLAGLSAYGQKNRMAGIKACRLCRQSFSPIGRPGSRS
jgi:hypothetical protein